ncbi:MAG: hypothetical protein ACI38Q_09345 [Candidatus Bruticola sp.]
MAAGMLGCVVFLVCCWTPSPTPRIGEKQATVIMQYGQPDKIVTTEQGPTERQRYPFVYLHYRCGFLKRSVTIVTIDGARDSVLNVTQDDGAGY